MPPHPTLRKLKASALCFCAIAALAGYSAANAQSVVFETDFSGTDGTIPASFSAPTGSGTVNFSLLNNDYRGTSGLNVLSLYQEPGASTLSDYSITTHFRVGGWTNGLYVGLVGRYQDNSHFYHARMIGGATADTWELQLYLFNGAVPQLLDSMSVSYTAPKTYSMTFTLSGDNISLTVQDDQGSIVGSLARTDATLDHGTAGVRYLTSSYAVVYQDFKITTAPIPEPAGAGLILGLTMATVAAGTRPSRKTAK